MAELSSIYKKLEELKTVVKNESSHTWVWKNEVILGRSHLLLTKRDRMISYFTKEYRNEIFFLYKGNTSYLRTRSNLNNVYSVDNLDEYLFGDKKLGFVLLDTESMIQIKNWLNLFKKFFDEKTIFFVPNLVNTPNYLNKALSGLFEFSSENSLDLEWVAYCGEIKLYDIDEKGYDEGVCFKLK